MPLANLSREVLYYHPNELRGGIPQLLKAAESSAALPLDYGWLTMSDELVLVEHKAADDFAHSLRSGHLSRQLETAKSQTAHLYLVATGIPIDGAEGLQFVGTDGLEVVHGNWDYESFMAALLALIHGLQVGGPLYALNKAGTAKVIEALWRQTRRLRLGRGRPVLPKWRATPPFSLAESYARAFPGLGYDKAASLAVQFPTWHILCAATVGDLQQVHGVGKLTAAKLYRRLHDVEEPE